MALSCARVPTLFSYGGVGALNLAEVITVNGTDAAIKDRAFILYRDAAEKLQTISYAQFYDTARAYGNLLKHIRQAKGIKAGARLHVGVFMQNIPEFFYLLGGCAFTNATLVGINNAQVGEKLAFDINNIDLAVLCVDDVEQPGTSGTFLESVLKAQAEFGFAALKKEDILLCATHAGHDTPGISTLAARLDACAATRPDFAPEPLDPKRPGVIIFTSGTTGAPKGIEVTWQKLYDTGVTGTRILSYTKDDVGYVCMPVNHSNALYLNIMPALLNGAKILLRRRFSVRNFVKDLEESGATVWNCVGDPVQYVLNHVHATIGEGADFSHMPLRTVISTGTNAPNRAAFTRLFGLDIFTEVYGSTEAGAITAVDAKTPSYSVGRLIKDIRILHETTGAECALAEVDDQGRIMNLGQSAGEIVVSQTSLGASAFSGYYNLPQASAEKLCTVDGQEFYRMGDLGAVMAIDGVKYLIFLGRTGDWIRCKGENWAPVDAEKVVGRYPGITNAGIIGVPQAVGREDDAMYILEVAEPVVFGIEDFLKYCRAQLPHYMQPRFIRLVKHVPMTETLKLKKSVLKSEFFYRTPQNESDENDIIYAVHAERLQRFTEAVYRAHMATYTEATNRDTLQAFTKRSDLFSSSGVNRHGA